ncbi:MAG: IS200/IS605 family transposase [Bacteroidales bacterium]|nr:IS200/IS605 family transposase [Bacteroidales bacterium]
MSYTRNIQHIVFRTYQSKCTIPESQKRSLLALIFERCKHYKWWLLRVNAYRNHVHLLIDIPGTESVSKVVERLKSESSGILKSNPNFPDFEKWGSGYGAFSVGWREVEVVKQYIANQTEHHSCESFQDELRRLLTENGIEPNEWFDRQW